MNRFITSVKKIKTSRVFRIFFTKQTLIYFVLMAVLYLFSLFGGMFSSPAFTYAFETVNR